LTDKCDLVAEIENPTIDKDDNELQDFDYQLRKVNLGNKTLNQ
jgi:hypothetical protein